jgi:hypothetical protein
MFHKVLTLVLAGLLVNLVCANPTRAMSKGERGVDFAERVKKNIAKLGTGPEARVEIKLLDNRRVKGYVSEAGEDSFVVVDARTGVATTVPYPQVKQVKGNNLSTGAKIAIGAGVVIGVLLVLFFTGAISKR